jgi:hypothetical protein
LPQPDLRRGIDAVGEVILTSPDGVEYRLQGTPSGLVLRSAGVGQLVALRRYRKSRTARQAAVSVAHRLVGRADMPVRVYAAGVEVGRLRPESRGGLLGRLMGMGPAEISIRGVVRALLSRPGIDGQNSQ